MPTGDRFRNRVSELRKLRGWSQAELACRAGISRAAVSAIEISRLVPSVAAALALARVLNCSVEELFGSARPEDSQATWAWPPARVPCRYWQARIGNRTLRYPVEAIPLGLIPHDGVWSDDSSITASETAPEETLVMACCDPAANLIARKFHRISPYRLLVLGRSSGKALELLRQGLVHVAGVHLSASDSEEGNDQIIRDKLGAGTNVIRVATWEEGLAVSSHVSAKSVHSLLRSRLSWVGREPGSGARLCLDQLLQGKNSPRRIAYDHRGVAESIRCGWADVGVCHRLTCEEAGLRFLPVRSESYDLCYRAQDESNPRIQALVRVIQSASYRRILSELPGFTCRDTGSLSVL
jgi:molybdate-binding protein/transcriptional regulator with XRE-family HTH domain